MAELLPESTPEWAALPAAAALAAGLLLALVSGVAGVAIWAERKVAGRIQDRIGPKRVGGPAGLFQSLADGIKLLAKEDHVPPGGDPWLFRLAPYLAFVATFTAFLALPMGHGVVGLELNAAVFFLLAVLSGEVFGVVLAGYASGNKWSLYGGVREAAQVVSYEVPRALCVLVPVALAGTLNLSTIGSLQQGGFWNWNLFADPFSYCAGLTFFVCATASCKRAPFDLAEAESELVGGFHTEYSGMRWSFFFLAEYASMFAASGLAVLLFLGGWHTGLAPAEMTILIGPWGHAVNAAAFFSKCSALLFVMMWMRWSMPRLRVDQVMTACLKYLLPLSCLLLSGACVWRLAAPAWLAAGVRYALAFATPAALLAVGASLLGKSSQAAPNVNWSRRPATPVGA